jgi:hypothetical protein
MFSAEPLAEGRVGMIQFEYSSAWRYAGSTLGFALKWLNSFAFKVYLLRNRGLWEFDYQKWSEFGRAANFVALRPDSEMGALLRNSIRLIPW